MAGDNSVDAKDSFQYPLEGYAKARRENAKNCTDKANRLVQSTFIAFLHP
jgi:hypothetical protein